jgi:hypothetical protein
MVGSIALVPEKRGQSTVLAVTEGEVYDVLHYLSCVIVLCRLADREDSLFNACYWYMYVGHSRV